METTELVRLLNNELAIEIAEKRPLDEIQEQLAQYLNHLIKNDFDKLLNYLYRIDVSEQKLKSLLQQQPQEDAGNIISSLIIDRQLQKIETRKKFNQQSKDFGEEEKW